MMGDVVMVACYFHYLEPRITAFKLAKIRREPIVVLISYQQYSVITNDFLQVKIWRVT